LINLEYKFNSCAGLSRKLTANSLETGDNAEKKLDVAGVNELLIQLTGLLREASVQPNVNFEYLGDENIQRQMSKM